MKIKQIRVSGSVLPFKEKMINKYNLLDYFDTKTPAIFFGLYNDNDYNAIEKHLTNKVVVWCGSDALKLEKYSDRAKKLKNVVHIAMSEFISNTLNRHGIKHIILPITPTKLIKNRKNRGNKIYFYTSKADRLKYGGDILEKVKELISFEVVEGYHGKFTKEELEKVYEDCFIGLRLTKHDGLPNTVVELGLMGRKCVYNGNLTNSLSYNSVDDIVNHINNEYKIKDENNQEIVDNIFNELNIDDSWLDTDFYDFKNYVTVIVNSYNESEDNFRRAVESILNNKGVKIQLIVSTVSNDNCIEWCKDYNIDLVINEKPGIYEQINKTIPKIKGDFVCYASSNDIMYDHKLKEESDILIQTQKKVCYSNYDILNLIENTLVYKQLGEYNYEKHLIGNFVSDCAMVTKDIFMEFTPFDLKFKNHGYYDFWLRIYEKYGNVFINHKKATWKYIVTKDSSHFKRQFDNQKKLENKKLKDWMLSSRPKKLNTNDLSIIIPTYKNTNYIDECINSVIESTKNQNIEILVGIDGCKETLNHIKNKTYPDNIKFYYFEKNVGPYIIKNSLSEIANGKNLLFFDSDDIMDQEMVKNSITSIAHCDFIRHSYINFKDSTDLNKNKRREFEGGIFTIKKQIFDKMNGFEPWKCEADSEFALRMMKNGYKIKVSNNTDFFRRIHNNGLTSRSETGYNSKLRADYRKIYHNKKDFGPLPKKVTELFTFIPVKTYSNGSSQQQVKQKNSNILGPVLNKVRVEVSKKEEQQQINYEKVNEVVQKREVQKKPERPKPEPRPVDKNSNTAMAQNVRVSKKPIRTNGKPINLNGGKNFLRF